MTIAGHETQKDALLSQIRDDEIESFLAELVEIPSPTGHELAAATFIADRLKAIGVDVRLQRLAEDRANVIATSKGTGGGPAVMLNGHLDTSYTGVERDLQGPGYKNKAVVVDGKWMYGNGVHNMKNALASYVGILQALVRCGTRLPGDVILACVAGETERAPFGEFTGPEYEGFGFGTSYALAHGLGADMCILGEPTANTIGLSNLGVNWVRLSTKGSMAHTQHAETATNAIYQMQKVMDRVRVWCAEYRERHAYDGVKPACDITAINGGRPWRVSRTPVFCDLFLCVRTTPGMTTETVRREISALIRDLRAADPELEVEVDFYLTRPPTEISRDQPVVQALHRNHLAITHQEPEYRRRTAYMDSSTLNTHGIPTVVYGASGRVNDQQGALGWSPEEGEHIYLEDLRQSTRVVAGAVFDLCSSAGAVSAAGRDEADASAIR